MIRAAVVGVGAMGANHARVYRSKETVQLVGVVDADLRLAKRVAAALGTDAFATSVELYERVRPDVVSIAVPTSLHRDEAVLAFGAGCHVLVEKPIASTVEQARELIAAAARADRVLMVGHIERFNPAVRELIDQVRAGRLGRILLLHARRLGPFPERIRDVGVIVDLATHDLDVMRVLVGREPVRAYAETKREVHTSGEDALHGLVRFEDDSLALLEMNWLTPTKIREFYVTGERGMYRVDYLTQDLYYYENAMSSAMPWHALSVLRGVSEGSMTRFAVRKREPLEAEIAAFLAAVEGDRAEVVTGEDGAAALAMALALQESSRAARPVRLGP